MCGSNWPVGTEFVDCPECGEKTSFFSNGESDLTLQEAKTYKLYADFERFYQEEWPEKRDEYLATHPHD